MLQLTISDLGKKQQMLLLFWQKKLVLIPKRKNQK
jgi:hypothetical protein